MAVHLDRSSSIWPSLAVLRFLLALIVTVSHLDWFGSVEAVVGSFGAVAGFLVLSGYSIAASMEREATGFYRRRFIRIVPVYLAAMLLSLLLYLIGPIEPPRGLVRAVWNIDQWLGNMVMLQGFTVGPLSANVAVWSLSIECALYLIAPWLARQNLRLIGLIALSSLMVFVIIGWFNPPEYAYMRYGIGLACLTWLWLAGWLIFYRPSLALFVAIAGGLAIFFFSVAPQTAASAIVFTISVLMLIRPLKVPARPALWLGDLSYPLYLIHIPVMLALWVWGVSSQLALISAALLAAVLLWACVDRPLRRLLARQLFPVDVTPGRMRPKSTP